MSRQDSFNGLFPGKKFMRSNSNLRMPTTSDDGNSQSKRKYQSQYQLNMIDAVLAKRQSSQVSIFTQQNYSSPYERKNLNQTVLDDFFSSSHASTSKTAQMNLVNDMILIDDDDDDDDDVVFVKGEENEKEREEKVEVKMEMEMEMEIDETDDEKKSRLIDELSGCVKTDIERKEKREDPSKSHFGAFKKAIKKTGASLKNKFQKFIEKKPIQPIFIQTSAATSSSSSPSSSSTSGYAVNKFGNRTHGFTVPSFSAKRVQQRDRAKTVNQLAFYQPANFDLNEKTNDFLLSRGFAVVKQTPDDIKRLIDVLKVLTLGVKFVPASQILIEKKVDCAVKKFINTPDPIRLTMNHRFIDATAKSISTFDGDKDIQIGNFIVKAQDGEVIRPVCFDNRWDLLLSRSEELKMYLVSAKIEYTFYDVMALIQRSCDPYLSVSLNRMELLNAGFKINWLNLFLNIDIGSCHTRIHEVIKQDPTKRLKWYGGITVDKDNRLIHHRSKYGATVFEVISVCNNSFDSHLMELILNCELQLLSWNGDIGGTFNKSIGFDSPAVLKCGLTCNEFTVYVIATENPYVIDKKTKGALNIKPQKDSRDANKSYCLSCGVNLCGPVAKVKIHNQMHSRENIECMLCEVMSKNLISAKHHQLLKHKMSGVMIYCPHVDCIGNEMIPVTSMFIHQERVHGALFE